MVLDWTEITEIEHDIDVEKQAPVSEKSYTEVSSSAAMAGEPGVAGNVQDTGIGADGGETLKTEIEENITNYDYAKKEVRTNHSIGTIKSTRIALVLDYQENPETDEFEPVSDEMKDSIRNTIVAVAGLNVEGENPIDRPLYRILQIR